MDYDCYLRTKGTATSLRRISEELTQEKRGALDAPFALEAPRLRKYYNPRTAINSRTEAADFCSAAFSSAVSLI